jgi:hypothetical protein
MMLKEGHFMKIPGVNNHIVGSLKVGTLIDE